MDEQKLQNLLVYLRYYASDTGKVTISVNKLEKLIREGAPSPEEVKQERLKHLRQRALDKLSQAECDALGIKKQ